MAKILPQVVTSIKNKGFMKIVKRFMNIAVIATAMATSSAMAIPVQTAVADFTALNSIRKTGNQSWTGALGIDFNVVNSI
jgi:hypothetical protein